MTEYKQTEFNKFQKKLGSKVLQTETECVALKDTNHSQNSGFSQARYTLYVINALKMDFYLRWFRLAKATGNTDKE